MDRQQKRLGEFLIDKGLINSRQLKDVLAEQQETKEILGAILLRKKLITEKDLLEILSEQFSIPLVSLKYKYIDWEFVGEFSPSFIFDYKSLPLEKDDWSVTIAITNPLDVKVLEKAEREARGLKLKLVLVSEADMKEAIDRYREYIKGKYF